MNFYLNPIFSKEFSFTDMSLVLEINENLNEYFKTISYDVWFTELIVGILCFPEKDAEYFKLRRIVSIKHKKAIELEFRIDFKKFYSLKGQQKITFLKEQIIQNLLEVLNQNRELNFLENFDLKRFKADLKDFQNQN